MGQVDFFTKLFGRAERGAENKGISPLRQHHSVRLPFLKQVPGNRA
jgi:hypothetical protein